MNGDGGGGQAGEPLFGVKRGAGIGNRKKKRCRDRIYRNRDSVILVSRPHLITTWDGSGGGKSGVAPGCRVPQGPGRKRKLSVLPQTFPGDLP